MIFYIDPIHKTITRKKPHGLSKKDKERLAPGTIHTYRDGLVRVILHQWIRGPDGCADEFVVVSSVEHSNSTMRLVAPKNIHLVQ